MTRLYLRELIRLAEAVALAVLTIAALLWAAEWVAGRGLP